VKECTCIGSRSRPQRNNLIFSLRTSFQVLNDRFSFWEPRFRSISRSGSDIENLDSSLLSRILATSVQVLKAVSWVITVTEIKIPKSKNSSTYPTPPLLQSTSQWCLSVCLSVQAVPGNCPNRQIDTTVGLIYKMAIVPRNILAKSETNFEILR